MRKRNSNMRREMRKRCGWSEEKKMCGHKEEDDDEQ